MDFTVGVLLFGNYPQLARRCLDSILRLNRSRFSLRIGLNQVGQDTQDYVNQLIADGLLLETDSVYASQANIKKYPMMRRMVHDPVQPISTPYFMWFDDDSYVLSTTESETESWFDQVATAMQSADMIGEIWTQPPQPGQRDWVRSQSWYTGKPFLPSFSFCTGGWWTTHTELLRQYDWPIPELLHRGGDVMLGELLRQQGKVVKKFAHRLVINAHDKRGFNSKPIGYGYVPAEAVKEHR